MVACVALVFPDVDYQCQYALRPGLAVTWLSKSRLTECVAISYFCPPATDQVDLVLGHGCHTWVPVAYQLDIVVHLVRLDLVKHDAVDILSTSENLTKAPLDVLVQLAPFGCAVDQVGQSIVGLFIAAFSRTLSLFCNRSSAGGSRDQ